MCLRFGELVEAFSFEVGELHFLFLGDIKKIGQGLEVSIAITGLERCVYVEGGSVCDGGFGRKMGVLHGGGSICRWK